MADPLRRRLGALEEIQEELWRREIIAIADEALADLAPRVAAELREGARAEALRFAGLCRRLQRAGWSEREINARLASESGISLAEYEAELAAYLEQERRREP